MSNYKAGDKFAIEIGEVMKDERGKPIYKVKGYNTLVFDNNGLDRLERLGEAEEWPKTGDVYYFITSAGRVSSDRWLDHSSDICHKEADNVFRTQEEAKARADLLRWLAADPARWRKIAVWREMMEYADVWSNGEYMYMILMRNGKIEIMSTNFIRGEPVFATSERAHACITAIGEERLKRDWFGVTG